MKKKVRIITAVLFVVLAFPMINGVKKSLDKEIARFKEARKVSTEAEFAEALKSDGWIYAHGAFEGVAPLSDLMQGKHMYGSFQKVSDEDIRKNISRIKGNYIMLSLKMGIVKREELNDPFEMNVRYEASSYAEELTFLGQKFDTKKMTAKMPISRISYHPINGNSHRAYEIMGISSPHDAWMILLVENGQIVDDKLKIKDSSHIEMLEEAADGDSSAYKRTYIFLFIIFWALLLWLVLWLEGKLIKS